MPVRNAFLQRQLSPVEVEVLCRDLLPDAKPRAFCNLMKSLQRHVLPQIQAVSTARPGVDRGEILNQGDKREVRLDIHHE